ncbi:hypothetical protein ACXYMO_03325 [Arenibacterium sp. CAU 1754]
MTVQNCITQAALLYHETPSPDLAAVARALNAHLEGRSDLALTVAPNGTSQYLLLVNRSYHIVFAVHATPLDAKAFERALDAPSTGPRDDEFATKLRQHKSHILVMIGDGPMPMPFDQPDAFDPATKLELLHLVVRHLIQSARPDAVHFASSDMVFSPEQVEKAGDASLPVALCTHPVPTPLKINGDGIKGTGLRFENSQLLVGKTVEIEGLPPQVPLDIGVALGHTLIRQRLKGKLPLADGDTVNPSGGLPLHVRHEPANDIAPQGRIIASFWSPDLSADSTAQADATPFVPHPGYLAVSHPTDTPETTASDDWHPAGTSSTLSDPTPQSSNSRWMVFGAIALFLWVIVPFLGLPRLALEATFSDQLLTTDTAVPIDNN